MTTEAERSYTTTQASRVTGVNAKTLHHWDSGTYLISPSSSRANGTGTRRRYSHSDLIILAVVAALRRNGARIADLRWLVKFLRFQLANGSTWKHGTFLIHSRLFNRIVFWEGLPKFIGGELKMIEHAFHVVPLATVIEDLEARIEELFGSKPAKENRP